ncbi:MAG: hypothetical protein LBG88_00760 [Christensenellaceae bacterium]|jgi:hypothetical protein|nr:hypothetical protein [Christensenellaceae bacterium]
MNNYFEVQIEYENATDKPTLCGVLEFENDVRAIKDGDKGKFIKQFKGIVDGKGVLGHMEMSPYNSTLQFRKFAKDHASSVFSLKTNRDFVFSGTCDTSGTKQPENVSFTKFVCLSDEEVQEKGIKETLNKGYKEIGFGLERELS